MLAVLPQPAWTVVQTAAWAGFRNSELRGLRWEDFDGETLTVRRSVWNSVTSEPKTKRSKAPVPVVKRLADALEAHKLRAGIPGAAGLADLPGRQREAAQPRQSRAARDRSRTIALRR